jgi:alpha-1,4-digalacturonate transport system substrate-binding protein
MRTWRWGAGLMTVVAIGLVAAACAPGPTVPASPTPGASPTEPSASVGPSPSGATGTIDWSSFKGKTLTYIYFTDGPDEQATRTLIAAFEKETGATVDLQIVPYDDLATSLNARLSAGDAPDVARLTDVQPFREDLLDLTQYFGPQYVDEFLPGPVSSAFIDGKLLAVPSDLTMNGPFVNVDQFTKAGVPVPTKGEQWTFDQMVADAEQVQAANNTPFALALDFSGHRVSTILSWYGTSFFNKEGQWALDPDKAAKALTALTDLIKADKISKDFWLQAGSKYKGANEIFLAGAAPVYLSGNWQVAAFSKSAPFSWAAVPNPCVERCGGFPGGKFMGAFKKSKNPELAAAFVQWMNRTENQEKFAQMSLFLPTRRDLAERGISYPERSQDMNVFLSDLTKTPEDTYATLSNPAFGVAANTLRAEIAKVVAGQEDVATAIENTKKAALEALASAGN